MKSIIRLVSADACKLEVRECGEGQDQVQVFIASEEKLHDSWVTYNYQLKK